MKEKCHDFQAWELPAKTQISMAVKLTFCGEKNCLQGKETKGTKSKQTGSTDFSSTANICQKCEVHSRTAIAHCSCVIVNTAAAVTLTGSHAYTLLHHVWAEKKSMFSKF